MNSPILRKCDRMVTVEVRNIDINRFNRKLELAQKRLDDAIIRDCHPFTPVRKGVLRASVNTHTVRGSGLIIYPGPYAHYIYEGKDMVGVRTKRHRADKDEPKEYNGKVLYYHEPGTGEKWFEKAKEQNLDKWIRTVGTILNS